MADVQVQNPPPERGGTPGWLWALVVLIIVAVLAWFVLNNADTDGTTDVDIDANIEAPGDAGGGGGGGGGEGR